MRAFLAGKILLGFLLLGLGTAFAAQAFTATSTNFELHAGDLESITGRATSTSFAGISAGGQEATGFSNSAAYRAYSGILYWLGGLFRPDYVQVHYRWRNDDGSESSASWAAAEDNALLNLNILTLKRLRLEISNEGWTRGSGPDLALEYARLSSGTDCLNGPFGSAYASVPTDASGHFQIATTTNLTDNSATTNVSGGLTDANPLFRAGVVRTLANNTGAVSLNSEQFTEVEFGLLATANATNGARYCFRLTNAGATANFTYSQYAQVTVQTGLPPTGDLSSAVFDTTGSSDGPAYNSIMWKGTAGTGKVRFQLATSACPNAEINPPTCTTPGSWSFFGGATCGAGDWYEAAAGAPAEITCSPANHNNQRYFRYKIQLCSATDCASNGATSPVVDEVIVNWAP